MQENLQDYVLESTDVLVFPLVRQEVELLHDNSVAFSAYIKVWYDGVDYKSQPYQKLYNKQLKKLVDNDDEWLWHTFWVILSVKDRTIVGCLNFDKKPTSTTCQINFDINSKYADNDYAIKGLALLSRWAMQQGMTNVVVKTDKDDNSKAKVLLECGFSKSTTNTQDVYKLKLK